MSGLRSAQPRGTATFKLSGVTAFGSAQCPDWVEAVRKRVIQQPREKSTFRSALYSTIFEDGGGRETPEIEIAMRCHLPSIVLRPSTVAPLGFGRDGRCSPLQSFVLASPLSGSDRSHEHSEVAVAGNAHWPHHGGEPAEHLRQRQDQRGVPVQPGQLTGCIAAGRVNAAFAAFARPALCPVPTGGPRCRAAPSASRARCSDPRVPHLPVRWRIRAAAAAR